MTKSPLTAFQFSIVIAVSLILASVVNIYPMSLDSSKLRPMALMMVLVFWLIYKPRYIGVGIAFCVGIIADLLLDTRLGQQGLAAVVMAFIVRLIGRYLRQINLSIACMVASAALITFQVTLWITQYITQNIFILDSAYALLVSIICWPLIYFVLVRFIR